MRCVSLETRGQTADDSPQTKRNETTSTEPELKSYQKYQTTTDQKFSSQHETFNSRSITEQAPLEVVNQFFLITAISCAASID